jgi:hypothetical protein
MSKYDDIKVGMFPWFRISEKREHFILISRLGYLVLFTMIFSIDKSQQLRSIVALQLIFGVFGSIVMTKRRIPFGKFFFITIVGALYFPWLLMVLGCSDVLSNISAQSTFNFPRTIEMIFATPNFALATLLWPAIVYSIAKFSEN